MERAAGWLYRRLGSRYFLAYLGFEVVSALVICVGTYGVLSIYERMTAAEFVRVVVFACAWILIAIAAGAWKVHRHTRALLAWLRGRADTDVEAAWREAVSLPLEFVTRSAWQPVVLLAVPTAIFTTWELDLPAYAALILFGGTLERGVRGRLCGTSPSLFCFARRASRILSQPWA